MGEYKNLSGQWMCMDMDDPFNVEEDKGPRMQCIICGQLYYDCDLIEIYGKHVCLECCEEILDEYTAYWRKE